MSVEGSIISTATLRRDLRALGVTSGDGVFVHASLRAIGNVIGGARLLDAVGPYGLTGMPGFSTDAYFRLFPSVGEAFENTGQVRLGGIGDATGRLTGFADLVDLATAWISAANEANGDRE